MAETTDQHMSAPPGEGWQWAFSYFRQDIQDLRAEIRDLRAEMRDSLAEMNRRIDRTLTLTISTTVAIGAVLAALIKL